MPGSDHEDVRGRHGSVKAARRLKGPRVVRILDAEKASVRGAPGRARLKLAAANSSADSPPP